MLLDHSSSAGWLLVWAHACFSFTLEGPMSRSQRLSHFVPALVFGLLCTVVVARVSRAQDVGDADTLKARAVLRTCESPSTLVGTATFQERPSAEGVKVVDVFVEIHRGVSPGIRAVHIHETAQCDPCAAAGGHFDPGPNSNSSPDGNHPFHAGDLVNIVINDDGRGTLFTTTSRITLSPGPLSVFDSDGSVLIVHVNPDTYCPDGPVAGCAGGARAACGVIRAIR
jgi:superoxide dismutase, Cu-Zn family